jgi:hypothetical protein
VSEEYLLGCSLRQRLKWLRTQQIKDERRQVQAAQRLLRRDIRRRQEWRDMGWIGGRPEAPPQPTAEQMMRGGPVKGVAVSADTLRAQRRVDDGTGGSVGTPWVLADSSEEEDDRGAYVEHGVITQEAPGLGACCTRGYTGAVVAEERPNGKAERLHLFA